MDDTLVRFGPFTFDARGSRLLRDDEPLPLQPRVLDALALLLDRPGDLVGRDALMAVLWPGTFVTDNSLEQVISKLRRALGDTGRPRTYVETVSRRGYRFIATVARVQLDTTTPKTNLPPDDRGFVGRASELEALSELLASSRLVTVIGAGGVGKTRLARRLAGRLAWGDTPPGGGVWFCDLSPARDRPGVLRAIGMGLGLPDGLSSSDEGMVGALVSLLSSGERLVVLDNAEQVAGPVAEVVQRLLAAPPVRLLLTSRERLGIQQERVLELDPLGQDEAVTLLRVRAEDARIGLGDLDEATAATIVDRLDAIPLAITLAAPRLVLMSAEELARRLSERVGWLNTRARDLPERQRSLASSVRWSWELLSGAEQHVAAQCAVFRGGFTLAGAEAVLQPPDASVDVADVLLTLRDCSMLRALPSRGEPRFGLLEPVREFAEERLEALGLAEAIRHRHLAWVVSLYDGLMGSTEAVRRVHAELDNAWQAWSHGEDPELLVACSRLLFQLQSRTTGAGSLGSVVERAVRLAQEHVPEQQIEALYRRFALRAVITRQLDAAYSDALQIEALAEASGRPEDRVRAGEVWARLAIGHSDHATVERHLREVLEIHASLDDPLGRARVLSMLGECLRIQGRSAESEQALLEAIALTQQRGTQMWEARYLFMLGMTYQYSSRIDEQEVVTRQALALLEACDDQRSTLRARRALANVAHARGDLNGATAIARGVLAGTLDGTLRAEWDNVLGQALASQGDLEGAERHLREAADFYRQTHNAYMLAVINVYRAFVAGMGGDLIGARELSAESLRLRQEETTQQNLGGALAVDAFFRAATGDADGALEQLGAIGEEVRQDRMVRALTALVQGEIVRPGASGGATGAALQAFDELGPWTEPWLHWLRSIAARPHPHRS